MSQVSDNAVGSLRRRRPATDPTLTSTSFASDLLGLLLCNLLGFRICISRYAVANLLGFFFVEFLGIGIKWWCCEMASAQVLSNATSRKQDLLEAGKRRLEEFRKKKAADRAKTTASTRQTQTSSSSADKKHALQNGQKQISKHGDASTSGEFGGAAGKPAGVVVENAEGLYGFCDLYELKATNSFEAFNSFADSFPAFLSEPPKKEKDEAHIRDASTSVTEANAIHELHFDLVGDSGSHIEEGTSTQGTLFKPDTFHPNISGDDYIRYNGFGYYGSGGVQTNGDNGLGTKPLGVDSRIPDVENTDSLLQNKTDSFRPGNDFQEPGPFSGRSILETMYPNSIAVSGVGQRSSHDYTPISLSDPVQHIEDLTLERFSLQRAIENSKTLAESLAAENSSLTSSIVSQLKSEMEELQEEITSQLYDVSRGELESMKIRYTNAQLEHNAADERARLLASEVYGLEEKAMRLRSSELKLEKELENSTAELTSCKKKLSSLEKDRQDLHQTIDALQEEKKLLLSRLQKASISGGSLNSMKAYAKKDGSLVEGDTAGSIPSTSNCEGNDEGDANTVEENGALGFKTSGFVIPSDHLQLIQNINSVIAEERRRWLELWLLKSQLLPRLRLWSGDNGGRESLWMDNEVVSLRTFKADEHLAALRHWQVGRQPGANH
ncbi:BLISTER-like protein [Drosera capensis]